MMRAVLLLRFDAPMISFGASAVDHRGVVQRFPARSMLAGLLGNALGYDHRDVESLTRLQERLSFAARCDRSGVEIVDYQTADLGQPFMLASDVGWTTRGAVDARKGGEASKGTHIRERHYLADSVYTVSVALDSPDEQPTLAELDAALREPARPLFVGRKCCLPAAPLSLGVVRAPSVLAALEQCDRMPVERTGRHASESLPGWWPDEGAGETRGKATTLPVTDERDWANRLHGGRRFVRHGNIDPPGVVDE